jgi:TonB family protein
MGTATFPLESERRESLRSSLGLSLALHGLLAASAVAYTILGPRWRGGWGRDWGTGGATRVNAVSSLPSVPLPAPLIATTATVATENPGLYKTEPQPKPEPVKTKEQVEIPKFKETTKLETAIRVNKRIQKETVETPENAIPFGVGGKPSMSYMQIRNAGGDGGLSVGDGNFGDRYSLYVAGVRNRISGNWLLSTVSPAIVTAPRVNLEFDILRDGTISNVEITHSSGIPEVDRSALRAVLASNPLAPLPGDYSGNKVSVNFYFDFHR